MAKYSFKDDYSEGAHPAILQKLMDTNLQQQNGYGEDNYSTQAKILIKQKINNPHATIHFVSGGTQANLIVIAALLRPHESVISAHTGHINTHEAGAISAVGHHIHSVLSPNGKLKVTDIQTVLDEHNLPPHTVKPKLVYLSNTTEMGSVYNLKELTNLSNFCQQNNLILYIDGARLGAALTAEHSNVTLQDIAKLADIFYLGGTKNGALLGEAIIINNVNLQTDFAYHLKQRGALLSKGRLLGIQFLTLFEKDLFFNIAQHANQMAKKIVIALQAKGYTFLTEPESNQIFPILPKKLIKKLSDRYDFYVWQSVSDTHAAIRLVTSWATNKTIVDQFINNLNELSKV